MEIGLLIVFWYGILHAFGPDHLTAITDFSIGRQRKRVMLITLGFAIGHGVSLYLFALLLSNTPIPHEWLAYGDVVASSVIILMGLYLLYLVFADKIHVSPHQHGAKTHMHIWIGKKNHDHSSKTTIRSWLSASATMGLLMGMGGARGMLITLSALSHQAVSGWMVLSFTLGVALVFLIFGFAISVLNQRLVASEKILRGSFLTAGIVSCMVGGQILL
ncbi:hypothetical protein [Hydrogenovibrio kuenenii]|uniref:hypothetical protein n=1 Tax=Hydrogenovibrio kuenenii TaxID=63658 RepID=UPI00046622EB|nr:hypothetical protein [Hydrogenovibrio kuenenii]